LNWFKSYEKEARVSTAGIRGPQNILYPEDTRFPINAVELPLRLWQKLLLQTKISRKELHKLAPAKSDIIHSFILS
jgi:hypothetical protein